MNNYITLKLISQEKSKAVRKKWDSFFKNFLLIVKNIVISGFSILRFYGFSMIFLILLVFLTLCKLALKIFEEVACAFYSLLATLYHSFCV